MNTILIYTTTFNESQENFCCESKVNIKRSHSILFPSQNYNVTEMENKVVSKGGGGGEIGEYDYIRTT